VQNDDIVQINRLHSRGRSWRLLLSSSCCAWKSHSRFRMLLLGNWSAGGPI